VKQSTRPFIFQKNHQPLFLEEGDFTMTSSDGKQTTYRSLTDSLVLSAPWEVTFDPEWGGPAEKVRFNSLTLWNESKDERIKYYSGTAQYRTTFNCRLSNAQYYIDLGEMYNVAEVIVNGTPTGVWWQPPFMKDVTGLLKEGENVLEIKVVNLWPNRLIGDEFLPPEKRFTRTNIKKFTKDSPLRPSGLAGPVIVRSFKTELVTK